MSEKEPNEESNFIHDFCKLCEPTEIPKIFALWSAVSAISAAMGRQSFFRFGEDVFYPNFYIILIGRSAIDRKSTSMKVGLKMVQELQPPPRILTGSVTPQKIVSDLSKPEMNDLTKLCKQDGTGYICISEFSTFLNRKSYELGLGALLIDLYDCLGEVRHGTIVRGDEIVKDACITLIGCTTADWLRDGIPTETIGGGLTSRMLFIQNDADPKLIPLPTYNIQSQELRQKLLAYLQTVAQLKGEFILTPEASDFYVNEYVNFLRGRGQILAADPSIGGYVGRRHMHQLKLAMICSAASNLSMKITLSHILMATQALESIEDSLPKIMAKITTTQVGSNIDIVLSMIKRHGRDGIITRTDLQRKVAHRFAMREMDEILGTLLLAGMVEQVVDGKSVAYKVREIYLKDSR